MAKRPRIVRVNGKQNPRQDSYLRRLFEKYNGCSQSVRVELQRMEWERNRKLKTA